MSDDAKRDLLKKLDLEHLNNEEFRLLRERSLDKKTNLWAVMHLSECEKCARQGVELTADDIRNALSESAYDKTDLIEQTISYYFRSRNAKI